MSSFLDSQFMNDAYDKCIDATDTVAEATSIMYSAIASKALIPDHIADQIGHAVGGIVHDNWQYSCGLPWSIAEDYTNISNYFAGETPDAPHQEFLDADYYDFGNDIPPMQYGYEDVTTQQPFENSLPDISTSTQFEYMDTSQVQDVSVTDATDSYADYSDCDSAASADSD